MNDKISKEALCIRNVSSWAHIKPEYKFDSPKFNKELVLADIPTMSPKIDALLKKIGDLDREDYNRDGKYYKHIIYSDVAGVYGAKMIASSMIANGFQLVYNNGRLIKGSDMIKDKSFGLLTISTVYKKSLTVGLKKNMMLKMNERPANINGENIRFIVLDPGFKEGIDVFDVKYMHLLEPLVTKAEHTQVVGRGTRFCGQSGLPFIPNKGWPLYVFRYNMMYNDDINAHELYLKYSNQNISALNFIADLENLVITSAVDLPLTENIHKLNNKINRFYIMMKKIRDDIDRRDNKPEQKPIRKDFIKNINNIRGKIYTNDEKLDCRLKCKGALESSSSTALLLIAAIHVGKKELIATLREKFAKPLLCNYIDKMKDYCKSLNDVWTSPIRFFKINKKQIESSLEYYRRAYMIHTDNYQKVSEFIKKYSDDQVKKKKEKVIYEPIPPPTRLSYIDLHKYIEKHYSNYIWDEMEVKNKCIDDKEKQKSSRSKKNYELVEFTKTQGFIQNFLTPQSPYNGMFLYHSVGSGKTCSAIATATNSFDKQGYTILWVTRHTLKEDIWKNMFDKVCNVIIQEKITNGKKMPTTRADRMKLLGSNWLQPLSYKQFTNMIKGKNKFYQQMVSINGKEDPFRKTFIIIDEIHKIYSNTLSKLEKPNPRVLQGMIQNSYEKSGNNSLKLLVMSATPMTEDPMSCIKIINLLLHKSEQFSEDFEDFKKTYCNDNGLFTDNGSHIFLNKVAGLISYIDRSQDRSSFAYPIIEDIMLKIDTQEKSYSKINDLEDKLKTLEETLKDEKDKIKIKEIKSQIRDVKKTKKAVEKSMDSPNNIIEYINNCFVKDKKVKKKDIGSPKENGSKRLKKEMQPKKVKECPTGKMINPKTGRCITIKPEKKNKPKKL